MSQEEEEERVKKAPGVKSQRGILVPFFIREFIVIGQFT